MTFADHWKQPNAKIWTGRTDVGEAGDTRRLFDVVQMASLQTPDDVLAGMPVLLGFCSDAGVQRNQGRAGAAEGPAVLRKALANLPAHGLSSFQDAGDIVCEGDDLEAAQLALAHAVERLLSVNALPIVLGGGHAVAWGSWQGLMKNLAAETTPAEVLILNLDAHFDLRTARPGTSGTPFDQIAEACAERGDKFNYACLGVSELGNSTALFERANALDVFYLEDVEMQERHFDQVLTTVQQLLRNVDYVYLSVDFDVLSGSVMPAVSAPGTLGVPLNIIEAIVMQVSDSGKLLLADFAEFNPQFDRDGQGARVASRLIYRVLDHSWIT